jgi:hypothetical protein
VFHSIRKTVATLLEDAQCPEGIAADIIGHDKPTHDLWVVFGWLQHGHAARVDREGHQILISPLDQFERLTLKASSDEAPNRSDSCQ